VQEVIEKIQPVDNNLTELLNNIGVHSPEQERKKVIVQKSNEKNVREAWQEHVEPSKPRSLWDQQPHIDSTVLNRYTPMNDSTGKQQKSH